jgi:hypothetical protein
MKFRVLRNGICIAMVLVSVGGLTGALADDSNQTQRAINEIWQRAQAITLPEVNSTNATLSEILGSLSTETAKISPDNKRIQFFVDASTPPLVIPTNADTEIREHMEEQYSRVQHCGSQPNRTATLSLRNVPLIDCVRYVAALFDLKMRVTQDGIELRCPRYVARIYKIRPELVDENSTNQEAEIRNVFMSPALQLLPKRKLLIVVEDEETIDVLEKFVESQME